MSGTAGGATLATVPHHLHLGVLMAAAHPNTGRFIHSATISDRFWALVLPPNENGCRLWAGGLNGLRQYGVFEPVHGRNIRAHRFAWEETHGPIPPKMTLDHWRLNERIMFGEPYLCSKLCVTHLRLLTREANAAAYYLALMWCRRGHLYGGRNLVFRSGRRSCRTCELISHRQRRARDRMATK